MISLRLSPSKIQTFKHFIDEAYNGFITQEVAIETLLGLKTFETNFKAELGNAFHSALELQDQEFVNIDGNYIYTKALEFTPILTQYSMEEAIKWNQRYKDDLIFEMWHTDVYEISTGKAKYLVEFPMRIDAINAEQILDHKTKIGSPDPYADRWNALQWKCYSAAFPAIKEIVYWNWLFKHDTGKDKENPTYIYDLKRPDDYNQYAKTYHIKPTGKERDEVSRWIRHALEFMEMQKIVDRASEMHNYF